MVGELVVKMGSRMVTVRGPGGTACLLRYRSPAYRFARYAGSLVTDYKVKNNFEMLYLWRRGMISPGDEVLGFD